MHVRDRAHESALLVKDRLRIGVGLLGLGGDSRHPAPRHEAICRSRSSHRSNHNVDSASEYGTLRV